MIRVTEIFRRFFVYCINSASRAWNVRRSKTPEFIDAPDVVITVHGTGDSAEYPHGDKWYQIGSGFSTSLVEQLSVESVDVEIAPFLWSGKNSASEREQASLDLKNQIVSLTKRGRRVHLLAHSHGANVANDAAMMLNWPKQVSSGSLASITSVGAPFFKRIIKPAEHFGAYAYFFVVIASLVLVITGYLLSILAHHNLEERLDDTIVYWERLITDLEKEYPSILTNPGKIHRWSTDEPESIINVKYEHQDYVYELMEAREAKMRRLRESRLLMSTALILVLINVIALFILLPLAKKGLGRTLRGVRRKRTADHFYSIAHPNDEAISLLQNVEQISLEPFPKGALFRRSRTGGISWGTRVAICSALFSSAMVIYDSNYGKNSLVPDPYAWGYGFHPSLADIALALFWGTPILFLIVYSAYRLASLLILELGLRGIVNNSVQSALQGIALGRDGDIRVGKVTSESHYYTSREVELPKEVQDRMLLKSRVALDKLVGKYRSLLFQVSSSSQPFVFALMDDTLTWDSLIHTTYFDEPELVEVVSAGIFRASKRAPV